MPSFLAVATRMLPLLALFACSTDGPGDEQDDSDEGALVTRDATGPGEAAGSVFIPTAAKAFQRGRPGLVRYVVIHDIEGPGSGAVNTFRQPKSESSSHYVVDSDGTVVQMVKERDIANHAFHSVMNAYAIGIEHAGYASGRDRRGAARPYTDALYDASAKLVAELVKRYRIPIDRMHIIGHHQVPKTDEQVTPCRPDEQCGGRSGHINPGPAWDWRGYLMRVEAAARSIGYTNGSALRDEAYPLTPVPLEKLVVRTSAGGRPDVIGGFWATQCLTTDPNRQLTYRSVVEPGVPVRFETRYRQPTTGPCGALTNGSYPIVVAGHTPAELGGACLFGDDDVYRVEVAPTSCGSALPACLTEPTCRAAGDDCVRLMAPMVSPQAVASTCRR